jgi:hypothetical protein
MQFMMATVSGSGQPSGMLSVTRMQELQASKRARWVTIASSGAKFSPKTSTGPHSNRHQHIHQGINVVKGMFAVREGYAHIIIQQPMPSNVLYTQVARSHSYVRPPILSQGEAHVPRTDRCFEEVREVLRR